MTVKEALQVWQRKNPDTPLSEAKKVVLSAMGIRRMDGLQNLVNCEHLGLSTNMIDKILPLPNMKRLRILSLGRNQIRKIEKLEEIAPTLEQLWISYNQIEKLEGLSELRNLRVLYMSNNQIKSFDELNRLRDLPKLQELLLVGNPIYEGVNFMSSASEIQRIRLEVIRRVPQITKLDGVVVGDDERELAQRL